MGHGSVIKIYDCWSLIPPPTGITNSIVHMRTITLQSHPNTNAHYPFLLQTCARCKLQQWVMSHEMVNAAIQNLSLLCDMRPLFSRFAVRLRDDYGKTGILNTEPDQRRTDVPLLCHIIQGQAYWSFECDTLLNVQGR